MPNDDKQPDWQAVIARSLAFLCLQNSEVKNEKVAEKAKFLKGLGLSTADAAGVLNTTADSINELFRLERKAKERKRANKKGKTAKR